MNSSEKATIPFGWLMKVQFLSGIFGFMVLTPPMYIVALTFGDFKYRGLEYVPLELLMLIFSAVVVGCGMVILAALAYPIIQMCTRRGLLRSLLKPTF